MIIKVCGMRQAENIRAVETLGIHWMGFIFYQKSPRFVSSIPEYMPSKVNRVGVFVNATLEYIQFHAEAFGLHRIQLHGSESPDFCRRVREATRLPLIKALGIRNREDLTLATQYDGLCDHLLFDTPCITVGGSGQKFNWDLLETYHGQTPFLLAGGIGPGDAQHVLQFRHPQFAGIDLNSRFECAPAQKDVTALRHFIESINK